MACLLLVHVHKVDKKLFSFYSIPSSVLFLFWLIQMCQVSLFALPFYILTESISTVHFAGTPCFMQGCAPSPSSLPSSAHAASLGSLFSIWSWSEHFDAASRSELLIAVALVSVLQLPGLEAASVPPPPKTIAGNRPPWPTNEHPSKHLLSRIRGMGKGG